MFCTEINSFLLLMGTSLATFMVCQKIRVNLAVGYLLAGMFLGPSGLGIFTHTAFLEILGHIGILIFLFTVGLEIPFHRLRALRKYIFGVGFVQVAATTFLLAVLFWRFLPSSTLLILSLSLAFSSTAVVVQLLSERFELTTQLGRSALSILLFQDIVAIGIFMYLGVVEACAAKSAWTCLALSGAGLIITGIIGVLVTKITERLLSLYRYSEFIAAFVILLVLGLSLMTDWFHLSSELGAFVAGMAMASTHWRHQISVEIHPVRTIFLAIFFISMGIETDLWVSLPLFHWILIGLGGIILIKGFVLVTCARLFRIQNPLQLGALMGGCSEFLFMIVPTLKPFLGKDLANSLLLMAFLSMILTPFLFLELKKSTSSASSPQPVDHQCPIIIAGFGHIGQTIARILEHNFIPFVIIDYDALALKKAAQQNYSVVHGDARDIEFLKKIKIYESKVFLITFGHLASSVELVRTLRKKFPNLAICVQVRDYNQASRFAGLGAHLVVPEDIESGMHMASLGLQFLGFSQEYAEKMVHYPQKPVFLGAGK